MNNVENEKKYVVTRNGIRTSDEMYTHEQAIEECKRWESIVKKWPDGSVVEIKEVNGDIK